MPTLPAPYAKWPSCLISLLLLNRVLLGKLLNTSVSYGMSSTHQGLCSCRTEDQDEDDKDGDDDTKEP